MNRPVIAPIVEGHGEFKAVPCLLHRLALVRPEIVLGPIEPWRFPAGRFFSEKAEHQADFQRVVGLCAGRVRAAGAGLVLALFDCEDDPVCQLGPRLRRRIEAICTDVPVLVVLASREYETWFVAAAQSLAGKHGISERIEPPTDPESKRDAKGWLGAYMEEGYDPVIHQLPLTRAFDLDQACAMHSFNRLRERFNEWIIGLEVD